MKATLDKFGVTEGTGEQRVFCPECEGKKSLGINTDEGVFHCFRCGYKGRVNGPQRWLDDQLARLQKSNQQRDQKRQQAAEKAQVMWDKSERCLWHEYLRKKAILPLGIRQHGNFLVIPLYDSAGKLWNCQTVDEEGKKLFLRGGKVRGCYYAIQGKSEEIIVCEGFATGATLHMHIDPHARIAVAFNAANLKPAALALRQKFPNAKLVIAADDDQWTEGNPGLAKATEAAKLVRGKLIRPTWEGVDLSSKPTDFNDLWLLQRSS